MGLLAKIEICSNQNQWAPLECFHVEQYGMLWGEKSKFHTNLVCLLFEQISTECSVMYGNIFERINIAIWMLFGVESVVMFFL